MPADALAAATRRPGMPALQRAAVAALSDLLHGRVARPAEPGRPAPRAAAVPLGPWMTELATAAEPATVLDRAALLPPDAAVLKRALAVARARVAAGGYPTVPTAGPDTLEPGSYRRAAGAGAARAAGGGGCAAGRRRGRRHDVYDAALVAAVRRFQAAEGLEPDGRIGRITFAALNRPAEARCASCGWRSTCGAPRRRRRPSGASR